VKGTMRAKVSKLGEGAFWDFGICVYVRDYYEFRACYIRACYVRENYVAPGKRTCQPVDCRLIGNVLILAKF
jgi:hypothetical protein